MYWEAPQVHPVESSVAGRGLCLLFQHHCGIHLHSLDKGKLVRSVLSLSCWDRQRQSFSSVLTAPKSSTGSGGTRSVWRCPGSVRVPAQPRQHRGLWAIELPMGSIRCRKDMLGALLPDGAFC